MNRGQGCVRRKPRGRDYGETGGRGTVDSHIVTTRSVHAQAAKERADAEEKARKVKEAACTKGKAAAG